MGLTCSHGAFDGGYYAFNLFRSFVCKAAGGSWPPHSDQSLDPELFYVDGRFTDTSHPGLFEFLRHSDCSGEIEPLACAAVADDLESLLPKMREMDSPFPPLGDITRDDRHVAVVERFIKGCRLAAAAGEPLCFW